MLQNHLQKISETGKSEFTIFSENLKLKNNKRIFLLILPISPCHMQKQG